MVRHHKEDADRRIEEEQGNAIGLTRAFSPIDDADYLEGGIVSDPFEPRSLEDAAADAPAYPEDVDPLEDADYKRALEDRPKSRGRHARHAAPGAFDDEEPCDGDSRSAADLHAPSAFDEMPEEVPEYMRKSRRMRKILIGVIAVLLVLFGIGVFLSWQLFEMTQNTAAQQAQTTTQESRNLDGVQAKDASAVTAKTTNVPNLVSLLGKTESEAVDAIGHGAQISTTREVNEEGNPIKSESRIVLTSESAEARTGTPTVYAGFDEDGKMVQAGYSCATASLGFGSLSFADAVRNESIIEKTLAEAGIKVPEGTVKLPEDKTSYSTYASDGTTLTKEYCSFSGEVVIDGVPHAWSAVLSYDYSAANATGNLADTIRTIFVYVNA